MQRTSSDVVINIVSRSNTNNSWDSLKHCYFLFALQPPPSSPHESPIFGTLVPTEAKHPPTIFLITKNNSTSYHHCVITNISSAINFEIECIVWEPTTFSLNMLRHTQTDTLAQHKFQLWCVDDCEHMNTWRQDDEVNFIWPQCSLEDVWRMWSSEDVWRKSSLVGVWRQWPLEDCWHQWLSEDVWQKSSSKAVWW